MFFSANNNALGRAFKTGGLSGIRPLSATCPSMEKVLPIIMLILINAAFLKGQNYTTGADSSVASHEFLDNNFDPPYEADTILVTVFTTGGYSDMFSFENIIFRKAGNFYISDSILSKDRDGNVISKAVHARQIPADSVIALISGIGHASQTFSMNKGSIRIDLSQKSDEKNCCSSMGCDDCPIYQIDLRYSVKGKYHMCSTSFERTEAPLSPQNEVSVSQLLRWLYQYRMVKLFLPHSHQLYPLFTEDDLKKVARFCKNR